MGTSERLVPPEEWRFWIGGEPAPRALDSPFGEGAIAKGQVRDGGSLARRTCRIAAWLSSFDEDGHAAKRWNEVVAA
jgi:hypothetical protein